MSEQADALLGEEKQKETQENERESIELEQR